jgi:hypothetical protein
MEEGKAAMLKDFGAVGVLNPYMQELAGCSPQSMGISDLGGAGTVLREAKDMVNGGPLLGVSG